MKREIRAGAVAGMAGVGAVVDVGQESFLIPGIENWRQAQLRVINLPRLSSRLRKVLKAPREEKASLLVRRFPRAMFCEKCRKISMWRTNMEIEGTEPKCVANDCGGTLVAMRFVMACENGHLDDVPWPFWAHSGDHGNRNCKATDQLLFDVDTSAGTAGLASVVVRCVAGGCGAYRSLEDISNRQLVKEIFKNCSGSHPWIHGRRAECDAESVVLQRGATNLHFPSTISALDIPVDAQVSPAAEYADQIRSDARFAKLVVLIRSTEGDSGEYLEVMAESVAGRVGCAVEIVLEVATSEAEGRPLMGGGDDGVPAIDQNVLLDEEWRTIIDVTRTGGRSGSNFVAVPEELAPSAPAWVKRLIDGVLLIRRLREVRAYLGFQRVKPGVPDKTVPPDIGAAQPWLPASEVYGEGIALSFRFDLLEAWASKLPEVERKALIELESERLAENFWFLPKVDPILIAIHTLSHLLLRRWHESAVKREN